jgi:hypothetical protein
MWAPISGGSRYKWGLQGNSNNTIFSKELRAQDIQFLKVLRKYRR